ncbi:N-acetylglucosamine-6-phosphate deacetylase [Aquirufa aurantiipilula]|uniref:N-acetylglucosamine-6-phosphate deacetylase n=1 Tax=Aquirufa aurantiipilula TaxID=2696561 RepID=UPI001CAA5F97|nr:N-acetylglucosamine-6-phosphate deacetylase [Aquirufa aurantiipilula]MBZ1327637.1 N-acetylglucosamine-6-phosphate deacetylase [Aquirufa aurantiipilula]
MEANIHRYKIHHGAVILQDKILDDACVLVENGKIIEVSARDIDIPGAIEINAHGHYISPGFIDIHIHGGGGHDFMDGTVEAFLEIAKTHARYGTTAMLPTTLTSEKEDLILTLEAYQKANLLNTEGASFIGLHLEGPYFALSQRGAQDPKYIRNPDPEEYQFILENYDCIKRWSAAPELPGAIEFGDYVSSKGVLVALAHTDAIYEEVEKAFDHGYSLATHFYSAMSGVTRKNAFRYAGAVEAGYLIDDMDVEIIADGVHLPSALLRLVYKIKGAKKTALITDAMRAAGLATENSILGHKDKGLAVIVEDGVAKLPDRSAFAGSVATTDRLVRTMLQKTDAPLLEIIQMISDVPARIMKIDHQKGSLTKGKDADILIFDQDINIQMTMVNGRIVYSL